MKNKVIAAAAILFILGLFLGAFLSAYRLEASSPEGEISGGEDPPSVVWHEHWRASQGYASSEQGYRQVDIGIGSGQGFRFASGKIEKRGGSVEVKSYPDMVVSKWKVHGHIHFR